MGRLVGCGVAGVLVASGCMAATVSHHEHAFPEHDRASVGWGLLEAARDYSDAWSGDGDVRIGPMATISAGYAPRPTLKLGVETRGTGVGFVGKAVLGHADNVAGAVVASGGYIGGDDDDPITHTRTWTATGVHAGASAVLSLGNYHNPSPGKRDILYAVSAGPKAMLARLSYRDLDGGGAADWSGTVIDYGAFAGASIERWFFRGSAEVTLLRIDRPAARTRELAAYGGLKVTFSW